MPCLPNMFRKKKKTKISWRKEVVEKLEDTYIPLAKQQENLGKEIEECTHIAKCNAQCNKSAAIKAVQKKKRLEKTLSQVDNMLTNIETQRAEVDHAIRSEALLVCVNNAKKLKTANKLTSDSNKQRKLIDDITRQHNMVNEVSKAIRRSLAPDLTEEELAREFEILKMEDSKKNEPGTSKTEPQSKTIKLKKRIEVPQSAAVVMEPQP